MYPLIRLTLVVLVLSGCTARDRELGKLDLRDGDVIFQTSKSSQSLAIQRATRSRYSHVGLIVFRGGKPYVLEAIATVRYTPLDAWIKRGADGHYVVKRLRDTAQLREGWRRTLHAAARSMLGRGYDLAFEWSDDKIYCSELIWKAFDRGLGIKVGTLSTLGKFDLSDPVVRKKLQERYGSRVPMNETVISPEAVFNSPLLVAVVESNE